MNHKERIKGVFKNDLFILDVIQNNEMENLNTNQDLIALSNQRHYWVHDLLNLRACFLIKKKKEIKEKVIKNQN